MKIIKFLTIGLLIAGVTSLSSCKKEGPIGPAGKDGIDGNANVTSNTFTVNSWNWTLSDYVYYADLSVPSITSSIANTGLVQVYMESTSSPGVWLNMPWTEWFSSYTSTYNFNHGTGSVRVFKADSDLQAPSNPGLRRFKVIAIESSGMIANPDVDWANYESVKETFNLAD